MGAGNGLNWADQLDELSVTVADAMLREAGWLPPPTVHILVDDLDPPYVGKLTCRRFYRGDDARTAVAGLGVLPLMVNATRLIVTWEHEDLCMALKVPSAGGFDNAIVVLEADRSRHTLRWHPMTLDIGPPAAATGLPTVLPRWGRPVRYPGAPLPQPVEELLAHWRVPRRFPDWELIPTYSVMTAAGYEMRWIERDLTGRQPSWMRLLNEAD
jgi:hypothetical protein